MMSHSFGEYVKVLERLAARAPNGVAPRGCPCKIKIMLAADCTL